LRAPFSFEANRSVFTRLSALNPTAVAALFAEMTEEATRFVRSCDADAEILADFKVYMRYSGQGWEIPVPLTPQQARTPDAATFLSLFERDYTTLFGRTVDGMEAEITVWSVNAYTRPQTVKPAAATTRTDAAARTGTRAMFDPALGRSVTAGICPRDGFTNGRYAVGPAVVTEDETTAVIPSSRIAMALSDGTLDIQRIRTEQERSHG